MTLESMLKEWLSLRTMSLKPRTIDMYNDLINRLIVPALGSHPADELSAATIAAFIDSIYRTGKERTAELLYITLSAAYKHRPINPMVLIGRPRHEQKHPPVWDLDTIRKYRQGLVGHKHELALLLALFAGLRRGEVCGLMWEDIDTDANTMHIHQQRTPSTSGVLTCSVKSASSVRTIPIPDTLAPLIRAKRPSADDKTASAFVCPLTPSGLDQAHRHICNILDLPYTSLHGLRHTCATACIKQGADMLSIQHILGHSSYSITANIYTHPDIPMLSTALTYLTCAC